MKLSIIIATYYKKDGSTTSHLNRALESIKNQSYQNYKVYLIGDNYEKDEEFVSLSKIIDSDKIMVKNLPIAIERNKYKGKELWVCGGVNAYNTAIELSLKDKLNYICHLDHDDYWLPNHLEVIEDAIQKTKTNFVCTLSETPNKKLLPQTTSFEYMQQFIPAPNKFIHSSSCINFEYFNIRYRNMIEEFGKVYPSDADLWNRIQTSLNKDNKTGIFLNIKTVIKDSGMHTIKMV